MYSHVVFFVFIVLSLLWLDFAFMSFISYKICGTITSELNILQIFVSWSPKSTHIQTRNLHMCFPGQTLEPTQTINFKIIRKWIRKLVNWWNIHMQIFNRNVSRNFPWREGRKLYEENLWRRAFDCQSLEFSSRVYVDEQRVFERQGRPAKKVSTVTAWFCYTVLSKSWNKSRFLSLRI